MKHYNKLTLNDKENIISLFNQGFEFCNIIEKLGVSQRSVSRVLKEEGINSKRKNRYTLNESYFNSIDTERKAYILGILYADGFVGDEKFNNIVISLTREDKYLLEKISQEINFTGKIKDIQNGGSYDNSKPKSILNFSSKEMSSDLRKLGVFTNRKTSAVATPKMNNDLYRHFIRGYFDGDGTIGLYTSTSSYKMKDGTVKVYKYQSPHFSIIGSIQFLKDMQRHLPTGSFKLNLNCKTEGLVYLSCYDKNTLISIFQYLYNDSTIYLERKFNKWKEVMSAISE